MATLQLRRMAKEFSFQPETDETPIQVLGMNGAADMSFEHLWIMGMHKEDYLQHSQILLYPLHYKNNTRSIKPRLSSVLLKRSNSYRPRLSLLSMLLLVMHKVIASVY